MEVMTFIKKLRYLIWAISFQMEDVYLNITLYLHNRNTGISPNASSFCHLSIID